MIWQLVLLAVASVAASAVLFRHKRMLTFVATAGVMWEAHVLFLTWIERLVFAQLSAEAVFTVGAVIAIIGWGVIGWRKLSGYSTPGEEASSTPGVVSGSRRDLVILIVVLLVLAAAWLIASRNQYDLEWTTHGFFNGDVATFVALTQRAMETGELVRENPLAGNGPLEYPSLLHASVANVLSAFGVGHDWIYFLSLMTFAQIVLTVPLFFLLWDTLRPQATRGWALLVPGGLVLYVMALSWESFVYPQSHFFTTGLFLLMATLLFQAWSKGWRGSLVSLGVAAGIGIVLLFSNAVTGTAAVAMKFLYDAMQALRPKISQLERLGWAAGAAFWVVLFLVFTPGEGSLGVVPGFSYTAATEMGRLALPLLIMLAGALLMFEKHFFPSLLAVALSLLAFVTFVFSSRGIVVENASRFFYHALLIGWPLMVYPLTRVWYWMKLTFIDSTRTIWEQALGWGVAVVLIGVTLVPAAASVASTHDNLMLKDERRVTAGMREALWWIADNTEPTAVFLTQLEPPFAVPVYTGRAQLRSDIWLSPGDSVQEDVRAAFEGSAAAQEAVLTQADYLLLTRDQREAWEPLPLEKVFDINSVVIYQVR